MGEIPDPIIRAAREKEVAIAVNGTLSKSEFAAALDRRPSVVSNWNARGQLTALHGAGRTARVRVAEALAELSNRLQPGQQEWQRSPIGAAGVNGETEAHIDEDGDSTALERQRR